MLKEAKKALRVTVNNFDSEIMSLLQAGERDLEIAGVRLPGRVIYTIGTSDAVTDNSTLKDPLVMRAVITYAAMMFGNPPNAERLAESYELQKEQLMHATGYTYWGGDDDA